MQAKPYSGVGYAVPASTPMLGSPPVYDNQGTAPPTMTTQMVNMPVSQTTVVNMQQQHVCPVRDYLIWSIFNSIYMNFCCLGIIALVYSVKSRDQKVAGNHLGALVNGTRAQKMNIAATMLTILLSVIVIIAMIVSVSGAASVSHTASWINHYRP